MSQNLLPSHFCGDTGLLTSLDERLFIRQKINNIIYIVIPPVEIMHSDWIIAMIIFSKVSLQMNVTCHMTTVAHGHGVRYSIHRLQQPERGFAALADADIQRFN